MLWLLDVDCLLIALQYFGDRCCIGNIAYGYDLYQFSCGLLHASWKGFNFSATPFALSGTDHREGKCAEIFMQWPDDCKVEQD